MSTDYRQAYDKLLTDAVTALTAAGRLTWTTQAQDGTTHTGPCDWAEFVTLALAGAAANLDGIDKALGGRPGSWEADNVRSLLTSTVGHDEQTLLEHRTEPVVVSIHIDDVMLDIGAWPAYDDANSELQRRYHALDIPSVTGIPGPELDAALAGLAPATDDQEQQAGAIADLEEQLEQQRVQDWTDYGAALKTHIETHGPQTPDLRVPIVVIVDADPMPTGVTGTWGSGLGESLAERLLAAAVDATPVPGAGRSPLERLEGGPDSRS